MVGSDRQTTLNPGLAREAAYRSLRRAKEAAETANRAKSAFLATMSHELRTPLNAIIGFSEMILHEVSGPLVNHHYRGYVGDIHRSGTHLLQIINDILDLSKAEAGKLDLDEEIFDLGQTIRAVHRLVAARLYAGSLTDAIDMPLGLPMLFADQRKTRQVLLNLVSNAIKFTPAGGHIDITARFAAAEGLIVTVGDSGVGIAPEDLDRVLRPFEQVASSCSRSHPGTGLGLPLVKAIMERHGGTLALRSEPGIGTQAIATFPAQRAVFVDQSVSAA